MVLAMLSFSVMNVMIREISFSMPSPQIVFLRNLFSLLFMMPFVLKYGSAGLRTQRPGRHLMRSFVGVIAMELWFFTLSSMPVNEATALSFTAPLFSCLFAVLLLGERLGPYRIAALCIGFAGTLVIIRPDMAHTDQQATFIALCAASMIALAGILAKMLTNSDPTWRIVTYTALLMSLFSAPLALWVWVPVTHNHLTLLMGIALSSTIAQFSLVAAFARAPMVTLAPFDFLRLIFTAILAWLVFAEPLDWWTGIGASIIVTSAAVIAWRESRRKHATTSRIV